MPLQCLRDLPGSQSLLPLQPVAVPLLLVQRNLAVEGKSGDQVERIGPLGVGLVHSVGKQPADFVLAELAQFPADIRRWRLRITLHPDRQRVAEICPTATDDRVLTAGRGNSDRAPFGAGTRPATRCR